MAQRTSQLVHKPYPPCDKCNCVGNACRSRFPDGEKLEWPELVGISETIAEVSVDRSYAGSIIHVYKCLIEVMDGCVVQYVCRDINRPTHALAKVEGARAGRTV
nr:inhibitor of trypsin and hageman factor [Ipomoea batatas]